MICLAASGAFAREGHHGSSSAKTRSAKHSKTSRSKTASSKRKAGGKSSRAQTADKKLRGTGDIDVSSSIWKDIPPEELPVDDDDDDGASVVDEPTP